MQAAKHGKSVLPSSSAAQLQSRRIVHAFGDDSQQSGLRFAIFQMTEANNNPLFREAARLDQSQFSAAPQEQPNRSSKNKSKCGRRFMNGITFPYFTVRRDSSTCIRSTSSMKKRLGTGCAAIFSRPRRQRARPYLDPADVDFKHPRIFDSDTILDYPRHSAARSRFTGPALLVASTRRCFATWGSRSTWSTRGTSCWSFSTTRSPIRFGLAYPLARLEAS